MVSVDSSQERKRTMSAWTSPFSFGIFYTAVYEKNTNQYQYNVVNILFQGEYVYGQDMASKYCRNQVAISGDRVFEYSNLSDEQVMARINGSGITDMGAAVRTLVALLNSAYIEMGDAERNGLLTCAEKEEAQRFLTTMLRVALSCPKARLKKLTREMKNDILACRARVDEKETEKTPVGIPDGTPAKEALEGRPELQSSADMKNDAENAGNATAQPLFDFTTPLSAYAVTKLDYQKDRERMKRYLEIPEGLTAKRKLDQEDIDVMLDLARRSGATYMIEFRGTANGLADLLAHRIEQHNCTQIALVGVMKSELSLREIRRCLGNVAYHELAEDGRMCLAYAYDKGMNSGEFIFRILYSLAAETEKDKRKEQIARNEVSSILKPWDDFAGRVPRFLSPIPEEREASGDLTL